MSIESWKAEFYPIEAWKVQKSEAVKHSLQKWRGLLWEARRRHKVKRVEPGYWGRDAHLIDNNGERFGFYGGTCALCRVYQLKPDRQSDAHECSPCPLYKMLGRSCDVDTEQGLSPWAEFNDKNNPRPMIAALTKLAAIEQEAADKRAARAKKKSTTATSKTSRTQPKRSKSV